MKLISASILDVNVLKLKKSISTAEKAGVDLLHFDLADGCFVPSLTFGTKIVKDLRGITKLPFEAHLMVKNPSKYYPELAGLVRTIYFHIESTDDPLKEIENIKRTGAKAGVAINKGTDLSVVKKILQYVDAVLVMLTNAGYGGQPMDELQLEKIRYLSSMKKAMNHDFEIAADGGIKVYNARRVAEAGADILISGTGIFSTKSITKAIKSFKKELEGL
jgi:ribulose-phosphate 3-epimerase